MRPLLMANRLAYYAALGDSMSIDDYAGGAGRGAASLLYRNRDDDFPEWRGRDLRSRLPGIHLVPLAADGATSASVRYVQVPRLAEMRVRPRVVTVTMGGNDLLQTFGNEAAVRAAHAALRENASAALGQLRRVCGDGAAILLGTVYDPSDGTGDTDALGIAPWPAAVEWIARFNETLRAAAAEEGATIVADAHAAFAGHGLGSGGAPSQPEPRPENRELYYCGVVEPNAWGASAIRACWWEALAAAGIVAGP